MATKAIRGAWQTSNQSPQANCVCFLHPAHSVLFPRTALRTPQGLTQHAYHKSDPITLMDLRVHADASQLPPLAMKILRIVAAPELELSEACGMCRSLPCSSVDQRYLVLTWYRLADGLDFSEPLSLATEQRALGTFANLVSNLLVRSCLIHVVFCSREVNRGVFCPRLVNCAENSRQRARSREKLGEGSQCTNTPGAEHVGYLTRTSAGPDDCAQHC
jgi:hypothetical protein